MRCRDLMKERPVQALFALIGLLTGAVTVLGVYSTASRSATQPIPMPFKNTTEVDYDVLRTLMIEKWPQDNADKIAFSGSDSCYLLYSLADFYEFTNASSLEYKAQNLDFNDCDDRAIIMYGREREWFTAHDPGNSFCGSSFGLITGWMNFLPNPNCSEWRGHMMNIFADNELNVWGYDAGMRSVFLVSKDWCNSTYVDRIFI